MNVRDPMERFSLGAVPPIRLPDRTVGYRFGDELPVYRLQMSPALGEDGQAISVVRDAFGGSAATVRRSGALRFQLPRAVLGNSSPDGFARDLLKLCGLADERDWEPDQRRVESDGLRGGHVVTITSAIGTDGAALPVIGPGGRLTLFDNGRELVGYLVARQKVEALNNPARWVPREEAIARVLARFELDDVDVRGEFGYFEASRLTEQVLLRPTYVFVLDRAQPDERGPGWRTAVVEPATEVEGLEPFEGLEEWWDQ